MIMTIIGPCACINFFFSAGEGGGEGYSIAFPRSWPEVGNM
jgi:hypothetical protein